MQLYSNIYVIDNESKVVVYNIYIHTKNRKWSLIKFLAKQIEGEKVTLNQALIPITQNFIYWSEGVLKMLT